MARGNTNIRKRVITPDPVYGNTMVAKFTNYFMMHGKKSNAQRVMYEAFDMLKAKGLDPLEVFEKAIETVGPKQEVKAKRIGGAAYQVPVEVRGDRKVALAIRWILDAAKKRSNADFPGFASKLAAEFISASKGEGEAIRKRDVTYKMAESNKAFAHFKW